MNEEARVKAEIVLNLTNQALLMERMAESVERAVKNLEKLNEVLEGLPNAITRLENGRAGVEVKK